MSTGVWKMANGTILFNTFSHFWPPCIRLNDGPVRGYEDDVGNKTTMRFFYPESASHNPDLHNDPDTLMVLVPFKQQDLRWLKEILYNEKRVRITSLPLCLPSLFGFFLFLSLKYCFLDPCQNLFLYEGIPSWHLLCNCLCWTCEQFTFFAYSRSEKVFGDHLLRSGWGMSVKSECWTPTFCTRPLRNCSTCRCKLRVDRWAVTHLNNESSSMLTSKFFFQMYTMSHA